MAKRKTPITEVTDYRAFYRCHICGKVFYTYDADDWVYQRTVYTKSRRNQRLWFCSWGCMRKWDAEHPKRRRADE